jgi:hypothetical protein
MSFHRRHHGDPWRSMVVDETVGLLDVVLTVYDSSSDLPAGSVTVTVPATSCVWEALIQAVHTAPYAFEDSATDTDGFPLCAIYAPVASGHWVEVAPQTAVDTNGAYAVRLVARRTVATMTKGVQRALVDRLRASVDRPGWAPQAVTPQRVIDVASSNKMGSSPSTAVRPLTRWEGRSPPVTAIQPGSQTLGPVTLDALMEQYRGLGHSIFPMSSVATPGAAQKQDGLSVRPRPSSAQQINRDGRVVAREGEFSPSRRNGLDSPTRHRQQSSIVGDRVSSPRRSPRRRVVSSDAMEGPSEPYRVSTVASPSRSGQFDEVGSPALLQRQPKQRDRDGCERFQPLWNTPLRCAWCGEHRDWHLQDADS